MILLLIVFITAVIDNTGSDNKVSSTCCGTKKIVTLSLFFELLCGRNDWSESTCMVDR